MVWYKYTEKNCSYWFMIILSRNKFYNSHELDYGVLRNFLLQFGTLFSWFVVPTRNQKPKFRLGPVANSPERWVPHLIRTYLCLFHNCLQNFSAVKKLHLLQKWRTLHIFCFIIVILRIRNIRIYCLLIINFAYYGDHHHDHFEYKNILYLFQISFIKLKIDF